LRQLAGGVSLCCKYVLPAWDTIHSGTGEFSIKRLIFASGPFLICSGDSLVLVATAVGSLPGALGVQCSGAAMTSVTTTHERIGPDGTSAENGRRLSGTTVTVANSLQWACSTVTPIISRAGGARERLPRSLKRLAFSRSWTNARRMQKRARVARRGWRHRQVTLLTRLSLVLVATAVGSLPGALGVQCSGAAMTSVTTTHERIGPDGTSAENG